MVKRRQNVNSNGADINLQKSGKLNIQAVLPGIVFVLVLACGLLLTFYQPENFTSMKGANLVSGEWMSRYQQRYEEQFLVRDFSLQAWGSLRYLFFHEGLPGVLIGKEGWLFTWEEFTYYTAAARQIEAKLAYIQAVHKKLAVQNIALVIALVPDKARTYGDKLGRYRYPVYVQKRYTDFRLKLLELGILTPDLVAALKQAKAHEQVWLRTDTHWSAAGARVAAETLAPVARQILDNRQEMPRSRFQLKRLTTEPFFGDLSRYIPLGALQKTLGFKPEPLITQEAVPLKKVASQDDPGLFADLTIPVTLVGTSYSTGKEWAFDAALQYYLEADVLNLAVEGQGPFLPMQRYLRSATFKDIPPVLIIWEIPERYLPVFFPGLDSP